MHRTARTIGKRVLPSYSNAGGIWELGELELARRSNIWPWSVNSAVDVNFSSVSFVAPLDGDEGGTSFSVFSPSSLTVVANGLETTTSQYRFGGSSGRSGPGKYLQLTSSQSDTFTLGTGDFTIEFWLYVPSQTSYWTVFPVRQESPYTSSNAWWVWVGQLYSASGIDISFNRSHTNYASYTNISTFPYDSWNHVAVVRNSPTFKIFFNGVSGTVSPGSLGHAAGHNFTHTSSPVEIGDASTSSVPASYYIDDVRLTKDVRYTANFQVPTTPHPTLAPY